jgi:predicted nuclease of restriction endonuclease-like (RecB) superfamily
MSDLLKNTDYKNWLVDLKSTIQQRQIKAALAVNSELILLYWELGKQIAQKQENTKWGTGLIEQISKDLRIAFPDVNGFSKSNLYSIKIFYLTYSQYDTILHQVGGKLEVNKNLPEIVTHYCINIPWRHIVLVLQKVKNIKETEFYFQETIKNNWSRNVLNIHIQSKLYERQGKAISNFNNVLPLYEADLLNETLKNPYNFDFLTLEKNVLEREIENGLIGNMSKFLIELGKGFAFLGQQYLIEVGTKEYFLDLLFYHTKLHCYVVIELKAGEFEPEYVGKLNFYLSAVDANIKTDKDNPTIGILLCKNKDTFEVEFSLKDINKPIGVSEFSFSELPLDIQIGMPTVEELEHELFKENKDLKTHKK